MNIKKNRKKKLKIFKKDKIKYLMFVLFFQLLIVSGFASLLASSKPVELSETISTNIVVDEISLFRTYSEYRFVISANSKKFYFHNQADQSQFSNSELYDIISTGDQLSIIYYENSGLFNKKSWVVDARNEKGIYRSIEEYNKNKNKAIPMVIILFLVVETIFCCVSFFVLYLFGAKVHR